MNKSGSTNTLMSLVGHIGVSGIGFTALVAAFHAGPGGTVDVAQLAGAAFLIVFSMFQMYLHAHEDQPWVKRVEAIEAQVQAALAAGGAAGPLAAASAASAGTVVALPAASLAPSPTPAGK